MCFRDFIALPLRLTFLSACGKLRIVTILYGLLSRTVEAVRYTQSVTSTGYLSVSLRGQPKNNSTCIDDVVLYLGLVNEIRAVEWLLACFQLTLCGV